MASTCTQRGGSKIIRASKEPPPSCTPAERGQYMSTQKHRTLFFSNRVSAMLAGFLDLGGFAGPVEALAACALINWWDCRLSNPRYSTTFFSEHSRYSAQYLLNTSERPNHLVPKPVFETQQPACLECAKKFQRLSHATNIDTRRSK